MATTIEVYESRGRITLAQFSNVFVPFAVLLSVALLRPELQPNMDHGRAIYSIWVTMLFLIPALVLYYLPGSSDRKNNYWLLCWTAAFLAYLVHFYYTVGRIFHGSLAEVYAAQHAIIATSNLLDTAWWALDLVLAWFVSSKARWIKVQRFALHLYLPMTFFVSAVVIKHGVARVIGLVMTLGIVIAAFVRIVRTRRAAPHPVPHTP